MHLSEGVLNRLCWCTNDKITTITLRFWMENKCFDISDFNLIWKLAKDRYLFTRHSDHDPLLTKCIWMFEFYEFSFFFCFLFLQIVCNNLCRHWKNGLDSWKSQQFSLANVIHSSRFCWTKRCQTVDWTPNTIFSFAIAKNQGFKENLHNFISDPLCNDLQNNRFHFGCVQVVESGENRNCLHCSWFFRNEMFTNICSSK